MLVCAFIYLYSQTSRTNCSMFLQITGLRLSGENGTKPTLDKLAERSMTCQQYISSGIIQEQMIID